MSKFGLVGTSIAVAYVAASRPLDEGGRKQRAAVKGWSVQRQVLGQNVYNSKGELIGTVQDLIIVKKAISHVIIGVGGFLRVGKRNVAIPVADFTNVSGRIVLPAATRQTIRALARFQYEGLWPD